MDLKDKVVLLTGAKRIGAAVAAAVAERGAHVALAYNRSAAEADEAAAAIRKLGRKVLTVQADISDPNACALLVAAVEGKLGRLDVLVNMASMYRSVPYDELD